MDANDGRSSPLAAAVPAGVSHRGSPDAQGAQGPAFQNGHITPTDAWTTVARDPQPHLVGRICRLRHVVIAIQIDCPGEEWPEWQ